MGFYHSSVRFNQKTLNASKNLMLAKICMCMSTMACYRFEQTLFEERKKDTGVKTEKSTRKIKGRKEYGTLGGLKG